MNARLPLTGLLLALWVAACATPSAPPRGPGTNGQGTPATSEANQGAWIPGPGADVALEALWGSQPFALPARELAKASGGRAPRMADVEPLLTELHVRYDEKGRATRRYHTVWRLLSDAPELKVQSVSWASWHEKRPVIRTRVVSQAGDESWLDAATIVDGSAWSASDVVTDARVLRAPLPGAGPGAVVESLIVLEDTEPAFPAAASGRFETWQYQLRRARLVLEHPPELPLVATVVGEGALDESTREGLRRLSLDLKPSPFPIFTMARADVARRQPRVEWSTARSWKPVARAYADWVNAVRKEPLELGELKGKAEALRTRAEKAQATLAWLRARARYTALHLGVGALRPTPPRAVLSRGYGDCKDLSVAMVAALEQLGVKAHVALVQSDGIPTSETTPGLTGFNHAIVFIPPGDGESALWIDATAEGFPVGVLPTPLLDRAALVVRPDAEGLTPLPTRAATTSRVVDDVVIEQSDFGAARARVTRTFEGPIAGWVRTGLADADEKELEKAMRPTNRFLVGGDPIKVTLEHGGPSLAWPKLVLTAERVNNVDTGSLTAAVMLDGPQLASWADDGWLGRDGARKESDPETEASRAREILEATGLSEAQLDARPIKLDERLVVERHLRVVPSPGFVAEGELPASRALRFGPSSWTEEFTRRPDGVLEAHYRFDSGTVDFDAAALAEFRTAFWAFDKEPWPRLTLALEPDTLFARSKPTEAMAKWRAALAASPKDGVLRARYAQALSNLGLRDLAKPELDRALQDSPKHALVLMIHGDILRRDPNGLPYGKGHDRAGAVAALRKALEVTPRHTWPRLRLAELLERDAEGDVVWTASADLDEAIKLYSSLADEGVEEALAPLYDLQLRLGRYRELVERKQKERQALTGDLYGRTASVFIDGPEAAVQHLREIADQQQRTQDAATLLGTISLSRNYAILDRAAAAFEPVLPGGPGAILKSIFTGVKAAPEQRDFSSPEAAMRSAISLTLASPVARGKGQALLGVATARGKAELEHNGIAAWGSFAANGSLTTDLMLTRGKCTADGDGKKVARVRCTVEVGGPVSGSAWFVKEGAAWKLESLGSLETLTANAWAAASKGDADAAGRWLTWTAERLDQLGFPPSLSDVQLFKASWPPQGAPTPADLRLAAALARLLGGDDPKEEAELLKALDQGRAGLAGSRKRLADQVLASYYLRADQPQKAVELLKPLAESEGEENLFRRLAAAQARAGQLPAARALATKALQRTPTDTAWASLAAMIAERAGNYAEARAIYEGVYARTSQDDLVNNLLWTRYLGGAIDEEAEKMANRMLARKKLSSAELHTAAVVLLERGKVPVAAQLAQQLAVRAKPGDWDDARLQLRAQLLTVLGFPADAKATWLKLKEKDPTSDLVRLKERGLKALDGKKR